MKLFSLLIAALLLAGCASTVTRATPEALRSAPGSTLRIVSPKPYDLAYRKTLDQMKSCYERKLGLTGSAQTTVWGDKSAKEAQVSLAFSSLFNYRIFSTILLVPEAGGTAVTLYSAGEQPPPALVSALKTWLLDDGAGCPGDTQTQEAK
jgi:hypothetical protein